MILSTYGLEIQKLAKLGISRHWGKMGVFWPFLNLGKGQIHLFGQLSYFLNFAMDFQIRLENENIYHELRFLLVLSYMVAKSKS